MNFCANCKYWRRHTNTWDERTDIGDCRNEKFVYTGEDSVTPIDGLGYWDCESYSAGFETGENFGCIHWSAKEGE